MSARTYPPRPLVGVGAAVFRDAEVLLVKRGNPPLSDQWSLPGGLVAPGENLKEAVRREVREECAIEIEVGDLVTMFEYIERDDDGAARYHYIVFDFRADYRGGELATGSDAADSVWAKVDSLDAFGVTEDVRRVIRQGAEQKRGGR